MHNLTDVRLDEFHAHHFEGRWEESLTELLRHRQSFINALTEYPAPRIGMYRVSYPARGLCIDIQQREVSPIGRSATDWEYR